MMNKKEKKLSVKELIQAGGFGAIYLVVYFAFAMLLGFNPITFFITGPIAAVVLGTVYMLYVAKVPKRGAIFILSIFNGFLLSTNFIYAFFIVLGLIAELIAGSGKYRSITRNILSFGVFSCASISAYIGILFTREQYLETAMQYYGTYYSEVLGNILSMRNVVLLLIADFVAGLIGAFIGKKLLKKHFERAGIV